MSFEGIVQIAQENNPAAVNRALQTGWELLSVNALGEGLVYTIGRRAPKAAAPEGEYVDGIWKPAASE
ncbi:hypothetical protein ICY20_14385 [Pseudomonas sp. P115]|uniref:hypothetical protein n=1 Tax=Pseudomonas pisciculturae TaxID=2730413 RepID=UPI00189218E4|nr:hypothetical protein [Pseudomonas pisciculturae]MBF6028929.1 hypothetical protein [Pseudomonas pisciculturae]